MCSARNRNSAGALACTVTVGYSEPSLTLTCRAATIDAVFGGGDRRIFRLSLRNGEIEAARRQTVDRRAGVETARLDADHAAIGCARRGEIGLRRQHLRLRGSDTGFGLRDVGARHLADIEAVAGLAQLFLDDFDVAAL